MRAWEGKEVHGRAREGMGGHGRAWGGMRGHGRAWETGRRAGKHLPSPGKLAPLLSLERLPHAPVTKQGLSHARDGARVGLIIPQPLLAALAALALERFRRELGLPRLCLLVAVICRRQLKAVR